MTKKEDAKSGKKARRTAAEKRLQKQKKAAISDKIDTLKKRRLALDENIKKVEDRLKEL